MNEIRIQPVGVVRGYDTSEDVLVIDVYPQYAEGLSGIEKLEEIQVLDA